MFIYFFSELPICVSQVIVHFILTDLQFFIVLSHCPFSIREICSDIIFHILILMISVFAFPWSLWVQAFQFVDFFNELTFNFNDFLIFSVWYFIYFHFDFYCFFCLLLV